MAKEITLERIAEAVRNEEVRFAQGLFQCDPPLTIQQRAAVMSAADNSLLRVMAQLR